MDTTKAWYESRTIWGALLAVVSGVVPVVGGVLQIPGLQDQAIDVLAGLGSAIGGAIATWGRVQASAAISTPKQ